MNTYSDKWNFHFPKGWTPEECVGELERNLKSVMIEDIDLDSSPKSTTM